MTTAIERLEGLLDERDAEIERLQEQVRLLRESVDGARGGWSLPKEVAKEADTQSLPVPRLEFIYEPDERYGWCRHVVRYQLVMRHLVGHLVAYPLGETRISGGNGTEPNYLPFRDGCHAAFDAGLLGLEVFVIKPGRPPELQDMRASHPDQRKLGQDARRPMKESVQT